MLYLTRAGDLVATHISEKPRFYLIDMVRSYFNNGGENMRSRHLKLTALFLCLLLTGMALADEAVKIAVLNLYVTQSRYESFGKKASKSIRKALAEVDGVEVMSEKKLKSLSKSLGFELAYADFDTAAAELGKQLDVDFMVVGTSRRSDRTYNITVRVIQVATAQSALVKDGEVQDKKKALAAFADLVVEKYEGFTRSQAEISYQIGLQYLQSKNFENAIENFQQAGAIDPRYVAALVGQVACYYEMEDFDKAMALTDDAIALDPAFGQSYYYKATLLQKKEQCEEALPFFAKAIESDSTYHPAYYNWAQCLKDIGKPEEAVGKMKAALEINPDPAYESGLGRIYEETGALGEALNVYRHIVESDSSYSFAWKRIIVTGGDHIVTGDFGNEGRDPLGFSRENIIDLMKQAISFVMIQQGPSAASIFGNLGDALYDIGRNEDALQVYREWEMADPSSVEPVARMVKILAQLGRQHEAIGRLEQIVDREPDNVNAMAYLALAYADINSLDKAERVASNAMRKSPSEPVPIMVVADIKERRAEDKEQEAKDHVLDKSLDYDKRYDEAEKMFDEAIVIVKQARALFEKARPLFLEQGAMDKVDYIDKKIRALSVEPERIEATKNATIYAGD